MQHIYRLLKRGSGLQEGNTRRKTESTDANAVSSRSHAVLEVQVKRRELTGASVSALLRFCQHPIQQQA